LEAARIDALNRKHTQRAGVVFPPSRSSSLSENLVRNLAFFSQKQLRITLPPRTHSWLVASTVESGLS